MQSKHFWNEWFLGLTSAFLSCNFPKLLLLPGIERLDKDLTIAQMQGKFKLTVVRNVGHIMHEDNPEEINKAIEDFVVGFRIKEKVGDVEPIISWVGKDGTEKNKV